MTRRKFFLRAAVLAWALAFLLLAACSVLAWPPLLKPVPVYDKTHMLWCGGPDTNATAVNFYYATPADTNWRLLGTVPVNGTNDLGIPFTPLLGATNIFVVESTNSFTGAASQYSMAVTNIAASLPLNLLILPPPNLRCL